MTLLQAAILGLVQGLTEFIPVSSSGHLLLLQEAFGVTEAGLGFDVALHVGTLLALLAYFYKDIYELAIALIKPRPMTRPARFIAAATLPAAFFGIILQDAAETTFRSPLLVVFTLSGVAILMILAERLAAKQSSLKDIKQVSLRQALFVGLAQAVALIPGVSRSGSTITAGLFAGLDRLAATRFSFLLAIPITLGAVVKVATENETLNQISTDPDLFAIGIVTAFASGAVAIRFLLRFVAKHSLRTFAYYRLALAAVTLVVLVLV